MKEKIKRILDLVRAGKLTLDDAAPLLAALNSKLALQGSDRELVDSLLSRPELDTAQVAEHLLLLRGIREAPNPPKPPRAPQPGFDENWNWVGYANEARADRTRRRSYAKGDLESRAGGFADRIENWAEKFGERVEDLVETAVEGRPSQAGSGGQSGRILHIEAESAAGDEYSANIPVSLAPHLHKLIPPHGIQALENAGFSLEALSLLLEAQPAPGPLIDAEDSAGNEVHISIK